MPKSIDTSKAAFYVSGYLDDISRAVMITGVDFLRSGAWVSEAYVIFGDRQLSDGCRIVTTYDTREIPEDMLPSLDNELRDRLNYAESVFWNKLRGKDSDLASWLRKTGEQFNGPLTEYGLARVHLSGEFGDQIVEILSFTECAAIRDVLRKFEGLPKFKTRIET